MRVFWEACLGLSCHNTKTGTKQKEYRFTRDTQQKLLFFPLETCVVTHYQQIAMLFKLCLLSWILKFIFKIILNTFRKYPSKLPFILVDRPHPLILVKYSDYFFRSSLNLFVFQGEISLTFWKISKENYHLDHIHRVW